MLFNISLVSLTLVLSALTSVNTSPVPNSLEIIDLVTREEPSTFQRDVVVDLHRRQGKTAGGKAAGGKPAGGVCLSIQRHYDH
jgi:hypothetical protein